jgi:hypothetical protein
LVIDDYIKRFKGSEIITRKISSHIGKQDTYIKNEAYSEARQENSQQLPSRYETSSYKMQNIIAPQQPEIAIATNSSLSFVETKNEKMPHELKNTSLEKISDVQIPLFDQYLKNVSYGFYESPFWKDRAQEVRKRDNYSCQKCGGNGPRDKIELHVHHIVPRGRGGSDALTNLITLCKICHESQPYHSKLRNN